MKVFRHHEARQNSTELLSESEQLRERLTDVSEQVSVYTGQLQKEINRLHELAAELLEKSERHGKRDSSS